MTHSGGLPHPVGDRGQRYEISYFDSDLDKRVVYGWVNDAVNARKMANAALRNPSWEFVQITDREF